MNEETKLMSELEHFDPVPLHVAYPAALAPRLALEAGQETPLWGVVIPDLQGCRAQGDTQEEAMTNAIEAVDAWTHSAMAGGQTVPPPSLMDALARRSDFAGWTWFFVGSARLTAVDRERVAEALASVAEPASATRPAVHPPKIADSATE